MSSIRRCLDTVVEPVLSIVNRRPIYSPVVSMNLYLAAMARDAAEAFDLGDDEDDDEGFEAAMSVFERDGGLEIEKAWCAVDAIVRSDLADTEPFWIGEPISEDLGYGPAMHASAESVRGVAAALSGLTDHEARRRLDAALDAGAVDYPMIWDRADEAETNRQWAVDAALKVVALYERAAVNGLGVLAVML